MTPRQKERIQKKIKNIKAALAADKREWGGYYDDSRGLRYLPPELYIKIEDYTGGLRYMNWFKKYFPDDAGFPPFLFEGALIYFKRNRIQEAEAMAMKTFKRNPYYLDLFLGNSVEKLSVEHWSPLSTIEYARECLDLFRAPHNLQDFKEWLAGFMETDTFQKAKKKSIAKGF